MIDEARIPFLGNNRSRYKLLQETPAWVYHKAAAGQTLNGTTPTTATTDAEATDPTVSAGIASYENLVTGGLFTSLYHYKQPMVVEALDNPNSATVTIENVPMGTNRAAPAAPFKMAAGEVLKAVSMTAGARFGALVRKDIPTR